MREAQYIDEIPRELLQSFCEGKVVLFVGAGCSKSVGLPDWTNLLKRMHVCFQENLGLDDNTLNALEECFKSERYSDIALIFQKCDAELYRNFMENVFLYYGYYGKNSDSDSIHSRTKRFCDNCTCKSCCNSEEERKGLSPPTYMQNLKKLGSMQSGLFKGGIHSVITTNFDLVLEMVLNDWESFTWQMDSSNQFKKNVNSDNGKYIFHIHGRIDKFESLIHTTDEYKRLEVTQSESKAAREFFSYLFGKYTVLFIGYRVNDPIIDLVETTYGVPPSWYVLVDRPVARDSEKEGSNQNDSNSVACNREKEASNQKNSPIRLEYSVIENSGTNDPYADGLNKWFEQLHNDIEKFEPTPDFTKSQFGLVTNLKEISIPREGIVQYIDKHQCGFFDFTTLIKRNVNLEWFEQARNSCVAIIVIYRATIPVRTLEAWLFGIRKFALPVERLEDKVLIYSCSSERFPDLPDEIRFKFTTSCIEVVGFITHSSQKNS